MLDAWTNLSNAVFDALLGWLLGWSWTAALIAVVVGTGAILALVRKLTTNQDLLGRAAADRRTLKRLIRQAKARGERAAVRRMRRTKSMIALRTFPQEGLPLLVSIVPIAVLATWAFHRLGYRPPRGGEPVEVVFYTPVSAVGSVCHLVPADGLVADRWVQPVTMEDVQGQSSGLARWTVTAEARRRPYPLTFRLRDRTFQRDLLVGRRTYSPPVTANEAGDLGAEIRMRPAKLFGLVPGFGALFPPWLVAYLVLVIPLAVVTKRLLRVH